MHGASASPQPRIDMKENTVASAVALYPYTKENDDEISFKEGETLDIIEYTGKDWWLACNNIGETGKVPSNYLVKVSGGKCSIQYFQLSRLNERGDKVVT